MFPNICNKKIVTCLYFPGTMIPSNLMLKEFSRYGRIGKHMIRSSSQNCEALLMVWFLLHKETIMIIHYHGLLFYPTIPENLLILLWKIAVLFLAHLSTKCSWWAIVVSGCPSSVVVRRATCVVRRPSSVNIWCLHSRDHICDTIFLKLSENICFDNI